MFRHRRRKILWLGEWDSKEKKDFRWLTAHADSPLVESLTLQRETLIYGGEEALYEVHVSYVGCEGSLAVGVNSAFSSRWGMVRAACACGENVMSGEPGLRTCWEGHPYSAPLSLVGADWYPGGEALPTFLQSYFCAYFDPLEAFFPQAHMEDLLRELHSWVEEQNGHRRLGDQDECLNCCKPLPATYSHGMSSSTCVDCG